MAKVFMLAALALALAAPFAAADPALEGRWEAGNGGEWVLAGGEWEMWSHGMPAFGGTYSVSRGTVEFATTRVHGTALAEIMWDFDFEIEPEWVPLEGLVKVLLDAADRSKHSVSPEELAEIEWLGEEFGEFARFAAGYSVSGGELVLEILGETVRLTRW